MINTREIAKEYRLSHWAQIMRERTQSGLTIKAFCKQIGICGNTYFYWQRRLREAACEQLVRLEPAQKNLIRPGFTEVMVCEPSVQLLPVEPASELRIEISGIQIVADSSYPTDKLAALLREFIRPC